MADIQDLKKSLAQTCLEAFTVWVQDKSLCYCKTASRFELNICERLDMIRTMQATAMCKSCNTCNVYFTNIEPPFDNFEHMQTFTYNGRFQASVGILPDINLAEKK